MNDSRGSSRGGTSIILVIAGKLGGESGGVEEDEEELEEEEERVTSAAIFPKSANDDDEELLDGLRSSNISSVGTKRWSGISAWSHMAGGMAPGRKRTWFIPVEDSKVPKRLLQQLSDLRVDMLEFRDDGLVLQMLWQSEGRRAARCGCGRSEGAR